MMAAMNYAKVDAGLASALGGVSNPDARSFPVFIKTEAKPTSEQVAYLRRCGVGGAIEGKQLLTATLSARIVQDLANQGWIRYVRLASAMRAY